MSEPLRRENARTLPESEQPDSRARVLDVLWSSAKISSDDLCKQAKTHAAVRRVWEIANFYGYVIIGSKEARNNWQWKYVRAEPWARPMSMSVRDARAAEKARLAALDAVPEYRGVRSAPVQERLSW